MSKMDEVRAAMMQALKDKDKPRKEALSLLLSALKSKWIDKRAELTEEEENAVILREIKQAQESIDSSPADRVDFIADNKKRIEVYTPFAPQLMNEEEVSEQIANVLGTLGIEAPIAKQKGLIMKTLMPLVKGKADGAMVNRLVGELFK